MGNFTRLLKKHRVDYKDFEKWLHKGGVQVKRLDNAYERSKKRREIAEIELEVWIARHIDDKFFEAAVVIKRRRVEELEEASVASLKRLFAAYRRDRKQPLA